MSNAPHLPAPPAGYTLADAGEPDLEHANEVIAAFEIAVEGEAESTVASLRAEWSQTDLFRGRWLVTDAAGTPAALATLRAEPTTYEADGWVRPEHWNRGLGGYLLELTEAAAAAGGEFGVIRTGISLHDDAAHRLVLACGYGEVRRFWRMRVAMTGPPPVREVPAGIVIETVPAARLREFQAVLEASFAEHWSWRPETFEEWSARKAAGPVPDPTLWLWAVRGSDPVAIVEGSIRGDGGWINTLGVLPGERGQGLGEALLTFALGEFWRRGISEVGLGVDAENTTGATRLYDKLGFGVEHTYGIFEKRLGISMSG